MRPLRLFPVLASAGAALIVAAPAASFADARAVVACRRLPPGPERTACFERTSAELEAELGASAQPDPPRRPASSRAPLSAPARASRSPRNATARPAPVFAGVKAVTYEDGAPVFELDNGQVWASTDVRRLSLRGNGSDTVEIRPSPVGWLLRVNDSFFALQVVRRR